MSEEATIQKSFLVQDLPGYISSPQAMSVPPGFKLLNVFAAIDNTGQQRFTAVFTEDQTAMSFLKESKERMDEQLENKEKDLKKKYAEKLAKLKLYDIFNDIIGRFKIGDYVHYFREHVGDWGKDEVLEDHIKSFRIESILLTDSEVKISEANIEDYPDVIRLGESSGTYSKRHKPSELYESKEACIKAAKPTFSKWLRDKKKASAERKINAKKAEKLKEDELIEKAEKIKKGRKKS